ncbi:MAG: hypothetical protein P1U46_00870 [Patescibacteria group bacterium]|nr:hypothetical protein [Patescibacteria group bacterium]
MHTEKQKKLLDKNDRKEKIESIKNFIKDFKLTLSDFDTSDKLVFNWLKDFRNPEVIIQFNNFDENKLNFDFNDK